MCRPSNVVAGAHLAGPYNMADAVRLPDAIAGFQVFVPYTVTAWQKVYGDLYTDVKTVFKTPYWVSMENLLRHPTMDATALIASGMLPGGAQPGA